MGKIFTRKDDPYADRPDEADRLKSLPLPAEPPQVIAPLHVASVGLLSHYSALPAAQDQRPLCTWPLDTEEGRVKLHRVINGDSRPLWDECERSPAEIAVSDLAAHYAEYEPEDRPGELVTGTMLTLIGPSGVWHTSSEWVYRSLQQLALIEGPPPWRPAVMLTVERLPTRSRRVRMAVTYAGRYRDVSDR